MAQLYRKYASLIEDVSDALLARAERFMKVPGKKALSVADFERVGEYLLAGNLPGFTKALRDVAVSFVLAGNSVEFWRLMDDLENFSEALGVNDAPLATREQKLFGLQQQFLGAVA